MADFCDDAQEREAQYLAYCLDQAKAAPPDGPQERDDQGRIICAECGELIPLARLKSMPAATRCTWCQEEQRK